MALTDEQKKAVEGKELNKLLIAGPGTGKSETIIGFIEYANKVLGYSPSSIFILTFTRSATADIRKKINAKYKSVDTRPIVSTLHGFALRQVMKNSSIVKSLPMNFVIADDFDERYIIQEDIKRYLSIKRIDDVKDLFNKLAANWETLNADRSGWETSFTNPEFIGLWQMHREIYGYALRSELVYQLKNILVQEENPRLDGPMNVLIVDEYQDLNRCDIFVIKELSKREVKLFCAGDDDQSIYGFRYAYPEGIRRFKDDILDSEQYLFTKCFRCGSSILDFALKIIRQDPDRIPKRIESVTGEIGSSTVIRFENQDVEAAKIAEICKNLHESGIKLSEIIILLRSDRYAIFSTPIISELRRLGLSVVFKKDFFEIFESNRGRKFVSIVKLVLNINNGLALRMFIQESKGIGSKTIDNIFEVARTEKKRFSQIIYEYLNSKRSDISLTKDVVDSLNAIRTPAFITEMSSKTLTETFEALFSFVPELKTEDKEIIMELLEKEQIESLEEFSTLVSDTIGPEENDYTGIEAIRIMTMHQAKGLSADAVFVVGVEEEYLPGRGNPEEERRLLYVSVTRARKHLFITYCNNRTGRQSHSGNLQSPTSRRNLSRFIKDIPNLIIINGNEFHLPIAST